MGIRNAGTIIKETRLKAGLTQEQLSSEICSLASICNIETGKMGVSPSTFHALMSRAGAPCEVYPLFKNRKDFNAFILLKNIRLYADTNCLNLAYEELIKLKLSNYGDNKCYYQEALFFYARLKYQTYNTDYSLILDILSKCMSITHVNFNPSNFAGELFSSVDYEIIFLMANVYANMGKVDESLDICSQAEKSICKSITDDKYNAYTRMLCHFTFGKCFFLKKEYKKAKEYVDSADKISTTYFIESYRLEVLLLKTITDYAVNNASLSPDLLYLLSLASYLGYGFVKELKSFLAKLNIPYKFYDVKNPAVISLPEYNFYVSCDSLSDGSFDLYSKDVLTIGSLIGILRKEQRLSLANLCRGLCSVSKLSKIENQRQEPGIFLAEALLNRLGYSERNFIFYGNKSESVYWNQKNVLINKNRQGNLHSEDIQKIIDDGIASSEPTMRQLCLLLKNSSVPSEKQCDALINAIKISFSDYSIKTISQSRLSWIEISILNRLCTNYILLGKYNEAASLNMALCAYSSNSFITPSFKNTALLLSIRLRFRYLYNIGKYDDILKEYASIKDEFLLKSPNSAADFLFYRSQACGELGQYDEMIDDARIAAGFFLTIGAFKRKRYLLSEIKRQFNIDV